MNAEDIRDRSGEVDQVQAELVKISEAVRQSVRALTISQYVLMAVLLLHALMVKKGW